MFNNVFSHSGSELYVSSISFCFISFVSAIDKDGDSGDDNSILELASLILLNELLLVLLSNSYCEEDELSKDEE